MEEAQDNLLMLSHIKQKQQKEIYCSVHPENIVEYIILQNGGDLDPICQECYETILQEAENDDEQEDIEDKLLCQPISNFVEKTISAIQNVQNTIQEKLASEYSWFFESGEKLTEMSKLCLQQQEKVERIGLEFQQQLLQNENNATELKNYISQFLDAQDHDQLYQISTHLSKYLKIQKDTSIVIDNQLHFQNKKIQNYKNQLSKNIQDLELFIKENLEKQNEKLNNFDFQFQKSTFDQSQKIQEVVPGSEFFGNSQGYQRIYSSIPFNTNYQEVRFSFPKNFDKNQECIVVGIRKDKQKDGKFNILDTFIQKKDLARQCLHCEDNVNMKQIKMNHNQTDYNQTDIGGGQIQQKEYNKEVYGKIILDIQQNKFEIHIENSHTRYVLNSQKLQLQNQDWRIYFQFKGALNIKIHETYILNK